MLSTMTLLLKNIKYIILHAPMTSGHYHLNTHLVPQLTCFDMPDKLRIWNVQLYVFMFWEVLLTHINRIFHAGKHQNKSKNSNLNSQKQKQK